MADIFIAVALAVLTLLTAYLGVHVTLHPAEGERDKWRYKVAFAVCGFSACVLIGMQTYRNVRSQSALSRQMNRIEGNRKTPPTVQVNVAPPSPAQVIVQQQAASVKPKLEGFAEPYVELLDQDITPGLGIRMNVGVAAAGIPIKELHFAPYPAIATAVNEEDFPKTERALHNTVKKAIQKQKKINADLNLNALHVSPGVEHAFITTSSLPLTAEQVSGFVTGHTRLYVVVWATWKDENGTSGETETCVRLQAPESNRLSAKSAVWLACMQ